MKKLLLLFCKLSLLIHVNSFAQTQNVGIGTTNPQTRLHVEGGLFVNTNLGTLRLGAPGNTGVSYWDFGTIGTMTGSDLRIRSTMANGAVRLPFYFSQNGRLGINLDSTATISPQYALQVAARNKYAIYGEANQFGTDTVAGVVGVVNAPVSQMYSAGIRGENKSTSQNGIGVLGIQQGGGWGVAGFVKEEGSSHNGAAVYAEVGNAISGGIGSGGYGVLAYNNNPGGTAGVFRNTGGTTGKALETSGNLQFTSIGEGANKVLTSDASGNATWQTPGIPPKIYGFVHRATLANRYLSNAGSTILNYPNQLPTDMLQVTHNMRGPSVFESYTYNVGVAWAGSYWVIFTESTSTTDISETSWNVMVVRQ